MTDTYLNQGWRNDEDFATQLEEVLVGRSIVSADATTGEMLLSDGTKLVFDKDRDDCCSYIGLTELRTTDNVITHVTVTDTETDGMGEYKAFVHVVTEAGELNIAEADGDASNGYYLHGFALGVRVIQPAVAAHG